MYQDHWLATLDAVKVNVLNKGTELETADEARIGTFIAAASDMITQYCHRSFVPRLETRTFDARGDHIDRRELRLDADLLAVTSVVNGDGTTVTSSQYTLWPSGYPKAVIRLLASTGLAWTYSTDWEDAIAVTGIWGFHEAYDTAWVDTLDTVQNGGGMADNTQTLTVSDADGKNGRYRTRFQVGHLLRIEDEYLRVVAIETTTDTLTVLRAQLGTAAASHALDTAIYSYAPQRNIEQACIALAAWLYRNRATQGDNIQFLDGTVAASNVAPSHIIQTLDGYVNRSVR